MSRSFSKLLVLGIVFFSMIASIISSALAGFTPEELFGLTILIYPVIGALISLRQPKNPVGWSMLTGWFILTLGGLAGVYARYGLETASRSLPLAGIAASLEGWMGNIGFTFMIIIPLLFFPDGRLPSPLWVRRG